MKKFIYWLMWLWPISCQTPQESKPTLSDDQLAVIMADMAIAEGATTMVAGYKKDSLNTVYYNMVLDMHHISVEEYERNMRIVAQDVPHIRALMKRAEEIIAAKKGGQPPSNSSPNTNGQ